ncbi:nitrate reductase [Rodentibacter caecimuris]|uniref:NapC/NirT family cytochrome c n=1 Tax=Rodentibacter caecimuris TaxID=1796644 RepID=UPI0010945672|nr:MULTISPECIES: NapC/NirT family cytochrome c [Pasteurellaceae]MCQ9123030.1 NapC/NirT family cytochrome c [Rodentibacter heylii]MCR1836716.1 NapC/NirT family cytochrome c [Pasteurella caecimuris]MCU0106068.1 NapC/NirT family cytochrome c [Pasteurella caecimuris]TGY51140.1 nitrate reductase [Pasteurella caecimuris]
MSKTTKILTALCFIGIGAVALWGTQTIMHKTSSPEFCVSCHSMTHPQQEWEGSTHFANAKGIRAECADCHVPQEGWHYLKAKFIALKDVWYELQGKLDSKQKYEAHRAEMAQRVWDEMKSTDSETCRSCHSFDAMELSAQAKLAKQTHISAKANRQTCIDCHKGIVHFLPESHDDEGAQSVTSLGGNITQDSSIYAAEMTSAQGEQGGDIRLMPYAEITNWQAKGEQLQGTLHGWQQVGADSVVYLELGKRITVALVDEEARKGMKILQTKHDEVTNSNWKEVSFIVSVPKEKMSSDLTALNQYGSQLNQANCSSCHAAISADHYTANQWIGVVNSMKDRTSMNKDEVRALTIYLQRSAKDMAAK